MPTSEALTLRRRSERAAVPLSSRATSHTRALCRIAVLCFVASLPIGCEDDSKLAPETGAGSPRDAAAVAQIEVLRKAFQPIAPTETSDKQYTWREAKRKCLEQLERGPETLAAPALDAFKRDVNALDDWRSALLSVAAHTDRELTRPLLEKLSLIYDGSATLGVRTEALRLWCETSPAPAVKLLEPILLEPHASVTYPPKEQMLRHWIAAARTIRQPIGDTLAIIATDFAQSADARYVAVDELAAEGESAKARKALEAVLVESGSDGLLRRKAAQAMRSALPREQMCAILTRVSEHESDPAFLYFLDDMLQKNCR